MRLTPKALEKLRPRDKRYSVAFNNGLTVRVNPTGSKTFLVRIYDQGRVKDFTLGHYPALSIRAALARANEIRKLANTKPKSVFYVRDAFALWKAKKSKSIASYQDEKRRLEKHLLQHVLDLPLEDINAPLIIELMRPLEKQGLTVTLKRTLMRFREMLDLAVFAGYINANPAANITRLFNTKPPTPMASIAWQDLGDAFKAAGTIAPTHKLLFLWSLLTLLRPAEAVAARKEWIDKESNTLNVPAEVMKKKLLHRIPLTPFHFALIEEIARNSKKPRSPFFFCGRLPASHIDKQTLAKALANSPLKGRLVAHGIRSIGRTWLADQGFSFEVGEFSLAHNPLNKTTRAYLRSDFLEERRHALTMWAQYVFTCAACASFLDEFPLLARDIEAISSKTSLVLAQE